MSNTQKVLELIQEELRIMDRSNPLFLIYSIKEIDDLIGSVDIKDMPSDMISNIGRFFFSDFRQTSSLHGKLLTYSGLSIMKEIFDYNEFSFESRLKLSPKYFITFNKICRLPYYLDSSCLVIFEDEIAFRYKILSDIDEFLVAYDDFRI